MTLKFRPSLIALAATASLSLAACGGKTEDGAAKTDDTTTAAPTASKPATAAAAVPTLSQGPDVCFKAIAKHLGADTKVSEITSFFASGSDVDPRDTKPAGELKTCTVQYQNPADPRKLLSTSLDLRTGNFSEPSPVEISVMGGNAAEFRLEDHLIPLSSINAAALTGVMDAQKERLSGVFSKYAWSGVRLSSPGPFSDKHTLRLDIEGRLAANDIKESGYASVTLDGQKIVTDHLTPR